MDTLLAAALVATPLLLWEDPAPDAVGPPSPSVVREFELTAFYDQWVDVGGLPVVGSHRVRPEALLEAAHLIRRMIGHDPALLRAMADNGVRFTVMAHDEWTTDVPEHADLEPARFWDRRARGLGATPSRPSVSCGEENLLAFPGDPYAAENILIHEFAHAIHQMGLSTTVESFGARLSDAYRDAMAAGLWKDTYAATNLSEYWAEGVQSYFDTNRESDHDHGLVDTREELLEHDPVLYALCVEVFGPDAWRYVHVSERLDEPHLAGWDPASAPRFQWPREMVEAYGAETRARELRQRAGETPVQYRLRVAEAGGVGAMIWLGVAYRDGRGVEKDGAEAYRWTARAAESGDAEALDHLGWLVEQGIGTEVDLPRAAALYRRAAEGRSPQGRYNLGRMLRAGRGVPAPDPVLAAMWFDLAAMARHRGAAAALEELRDTELSAAQVARARRLAKAWH